MKRCSKCQHLKYLADFYSGYSWGDGYRPDCKECRSQQEKARRKSHGTKFFTTRRHGLTPQEYDDMLVSQGGGCAICGESLGTRALPIDHDHNTGTNRGILCSLCNGGLGMFRDRTALLESAIQYLEKYA